MTTRNVQRVIRANATSDGAGVRLRRSLGQRPDARLDPFLMLDEFSSENPDDYIAGFPAHPHRGFETVTYMLEGRMLHEDHLGNRGHLESGGAQWMTAGRGIIHSEMPQQDHGRMHGFQLWINLPAREKLKPAGYRDVRPDEVPVVTLPGGATVRVLAGSLADGSPQRDIAAPESREKHQAHCVRATLATPGASGAAMFHGSPQRDIAAPESREKHQAHRVRATLATPGASSAAMFHGSNQVRGPIRGVTTDPTFIDVALPAGAVFRHTVPAGHNVVIYVFEGHLRIGATSLASQEAAMLSKGDDLEVHADDDAARFLVLAARPLGEPVVQYGPFVMNTREEIEQALEDYRAGQLA